MLQRTSLIAFVATVFLLTGCAAGPSSQEKQAAYEQAMSAAKAAYGKSLSVESAWRDAEDLIKAAEKAAKEGEMEKAIKLATESRKQSELAYAQYVEQKNAGEVGIR